MPPKPCPLREALAAAGAAAGRVYGARGTADLAGLAHGSILGAQLEELRGRSVLITVKDPMCAALALLELDGIAARLVLCPADLAPEHLPGVARAAASDAAVADRTGTAVGIEGIDTCVTVRPAPLSGDVGRVGSHDTEWILLTSGTTGAPKLVRHDLATLTHGLADLRRAAEPIVWATFYDVRRYGGLQILLRALLGGSFVPADPTEPIRQFLERAQVAGVTHISGTPSHWRRVLMSGAAAAITPRCVRLSGEIADQAVLDALRATYPEAMVVHAFASTEAGVAFEVRDGRAGFPAALLDAAGDAVRLSVTEGTLRVRSRGNAHGYLGEDAAAFPRGPDGAIDTGDLIERRAGRCYFLGRRGGVINVGGLKVYPEEIEAVINAHPWVHMSLVRSRASPITGAVVIADVVLADCQPGARPSPEELARELLKGCRRSLAAYKVPATIRVVPGLELSASGKLVRPNA